MKKLFKFQILFFLTSIILIINDVYAQNRLSDIQTKTQQSIRNLNRKIRKLDRNDTNTTILINKLKLLSNSSTALFQKIKNDTNIVQQGDTEFIDALEQAQKELNQLLINWTSSEEASNLMEAIRIDYDIKIKSSPFAISSKVITSVEVSVITKYNNKAVPGYDVFYTYMWDSKAKKKKSYFNNQTNNAIKKLPPGYYFFWIEKNGVLIQDKSKVEIGNLMLPQEIIIFNL
jgi:hypothetical protein